MNPYAVTLVAALWVTFFGFVLVMGAECKLEQNKETAWTLFILAIVVTLIMAMAHSI